MNEQKLQDIVSHIDYLVAELKHLKSKLTLEEGLHLNVISDSEYFAIELWDAELLEPRMLCHTFRLDINDDKYMIKQCQRALDIILTPRTHKKIIYWNSDVEWDALSENYQKLDQVFKFKKRKLSDDLRQVVKGRIDALYCMSE